MYRVYCWRKEYGGLKTTRQKVEGVDRENVKLEPLVSEPSLQKLVLKDTASKN
jgi:hypothetical protein